MYFMSIIPLLPTDFECRRENSQKVIGYCLSSPSLWTSQIILCLCVFFFTTDRWPQLQASYCFQRGLKICVASCKVFCQTLAKAIWECRNCLGAPLYSPLDTKMPSNFDQTGRQSRIQCYLFFFFVLLLVCLQRHPGFHTSHTAALTTQRRLIRSGAQ